MGVAHLTLYTFCASVLKSQNSIPTYRTTLFIVGYFSYMFRPDLIGPPQGVLYDILSVHFNLPIRVLIYE